MDEEDQNTDRPKGDVQAEAEVKPKKESRRRSINKQLNFTDRPRSMLDEAELT